MLFGKAPALKNRSEPPKSTGVELWHSSTLNLLGWPNIQPIRAHERELFLPGPTCQAHLLPRVIPAQNRDGYAAVGVGHVNTTTDTIKDEPFDARSHHHLGTSSSPAADTEEICTCELLLHVQELSQRCRQAHAARGSPNCSTDGWCPREAITQVSMAEQGQRVPVRCRETIRKARAEAGSARGQGATVTGA